MNRLKLLTAALLIGTASLAAPAYAGTGVSVSLGYSDYDRHPSNHYPAPRYGYDDDAWDDSYRRPAREHRRGHRHAGRYHSSVVVYQPPRHWSRGYRGHHDRYDRYDGHHQHDRYCHH
jgi:hypothetical protein